MQFLRTTFGMALLGGLLFWLALPPLDLGPLAWLAPVPWCLLIRRTTISATAKPTKRFSLAHRPYLAIGLAYFCFWLAAIHWLTLPHWATSFGWISLSFYLCFYLPAFIALARFCVHQWKLPVIIVAPVVWVGLELLQSYLLTGFMMVVLGQTQYRWIALIQIADITGTYGVSFAIMLVAACIARMFPFEGKPRALWPLVPAASLVVALVAYGMYRTSGEYTSPGPTVGLIQGDIGTELKADPTKNEQIFNEYLRLTADALAKARQRNLQLDLIVWPETMFRYTYFTFADDYRAKQTEAFTPKQLQSASRQAIENVVLPVGVPMILGVDRWHSTNDGQERYNSAVAVDRDGTELGRYAKTHLVMFGEYVPFAKQFPFLYKLTPLPSGSERGKELASMQIGGVCYSPSICFETTLARVIRRLVNEARTSKTGCNPQVLVNLTNDGWFWGSAELDMHLICGVFRAVECRKPLLVAANTGFSAWIDSDGRIVAQARRQAEDVILAQPQFDRRQSFYLDYGDIFAWPCLLFTTAAALAGLVTLRRKSANPGGRP